MKVNNFKRIIKEDVKEEYRELVEKLAFSINPFAEEVVKALSNNLNIQDNFNQKIRDITVEVDSNGIPKVKTQFKTNLISKCIGTHVIKLDNLTNPLVFQISYPFINFSESNGLLTIDHVSGLPANNNFKLKLVLYC